uniref:Ig-like domain-containing protein n=1 Tax=Terrapene triunguis TaxID=2587831 RepID=A0A674JZS8_9SAUR
MVTLRTQGLRLTACLLLLPEPTLPKPSVSVRPIAGVSLGGAVAIWCRGQRQGMRFVLNTDGRHFPPVDSGDFETVFPISNVSREDGGSYSCSYHNRLEPIAVSYPSDPMELVVGGEGPGLASPFPAPPPARPSRRLGANGTLRGQRRNVTFFLHKPRDRNPQRHVDPAGDWAEFLITTMGRQQGGSYSCSYRPRSEPFVSSEPSDPVQLPSLPRPSISLSPTGVTAPGADVTIRCQGQRRDVRFFLHKAGDSNPQRHMDPAGAGAEFRIPTMGRQHGGSYSCSYQPQSESFVFSEPSDPVELVVLPAPRPSISVSPSGVIAVGGAVTIRCQCRCEARRLFLYKDKIQIRELDAAGDGGEFTIPSARWADGGVYMCQSRSRSEPPNWSDPSDIVRIIVAGEGPGSAFPLPAPHPARPSWGSLGRWDTPWVSLNLPVPPFPLV